MKMRDVGPCLQGAVVVARKREWTPVGGHPWQVTQRYTNLVRLPAALTSLRRGSNASWMEPNDKTVLEPAWLLQLLPVFPRHSHSLPGASGAGDRAGAGRRSARAMVSVRWALSSCIALWMACPAWQPSPLACSCRAPATPPPTSHRLGLLPLLPPVAGPT